MIRVLEQAIEKIRGLPIERQEEAAEVLWVIASQSSEKLTSEEVEGVRKAQREVRKRKDRRQQKSQIILRAISRMMRVRFSTLALRDLEEIAEYIGTDNVAAAHAVVNAIEEACYSLREFPELGLLTNVGRTRKLSAPDVPYKVIYEITRKVGRVTILRVYHDSRDSGY